MKHTPGPWDLEERTVFALNDHFCNRFYATIQRGQGSMPEELDANARLIAAAPDLLDACAQMDRALSGGPMTLGEVQRLVKAAIEKALHTPPTNLPVSESSRDVTNESDRVNT